MSSSENESGLELRLPWGTPDRQPRSLSAPLPAPPPEPPAPQPDPPAASTDRAAASPLDPAADQALRDVVQDRADRIDKRLNLIGAALPKILAHFRADLKAQQVATIKAVNALTDAPLIEQLDRKIDGIVRDLTVRLEVLEELVLACQANTLEALNKLTLETRHLPTSQEAPGSREVG